VTLKFHLSTTVSSGPDLMSSQRLYKQQFHENQPRLGAAHPGIWDLLQISARGRIQGQPMLGSSTLLISCCSVGYMKTVPEAQDTE
jgi:hypothetical protein